VPVELIIAKRDLQRIIDHCTAGLPNEACGILGGRDGRVEKVYCMRNARPGPASFEMDPAEQFRVLKDLRREGLGLSAIFHSHPGGPACPSGIDVERAYWPETLYPNYPGALYLIVSFRERDAPVVRAFAISDGTVNEALLKVE
jgi:proteasome lid subunit RPN8/RPN11